MPDKESDDRDQFSPQEKVDLVLELLKGKEDLQTFAAEHKVSPELLAAWREEFLAKAASVFDHGKDKKAAGARAAKDRRMAEATATIDKRMAEAIVAEKKEKAGYMKKARQLTKEVNWLKKVSEELLGPDYEKHFSPKPFEE